MMKVLLVCLAVAVVVSGHCLNECNGHGVCEPLTFECQCTEPWSGQDCSTYAQDLQNNVPVEDLIVNTRQWNYFHIEANSDRSDLVIEVNQTSSGGDCDTYVRLGDLPTRSVYDERDISTGQNARIEIEHPHGVYYIGVYGFLSAHYNVKAYMKSDCPNDCTGHGSCEWDPVYNAPVCSCYSDWYGDQCSQKVIPLVNDTEVSATVRKRKFRYYSFVNDDANTFTVEIAQGDTTEEDCDLYVRYGHLPTQAEYDYRDVSVAENVNLQVTEAKSGTYYLGVYGFNECNYRLKYYSYNTCPNECSGSSHGACRADGITCECTVRFTGEGCETMVTSLPFSTGMTGYVSANSWNYYHFTASSSGAVLVNVVQDDPSMDCDLYVRYLLEPTNVLYDFRDNSFSSDMTIEIPEPETAEYFIGVFGYQQCSYTLTTSMSQNCPQNCEEHGTCHTGGRCECDEGWAGEDCSAPIKGLTPGNPWPKRNIGAGEWHYYSFDAVQGYEVVVVLRETTLGHEGSVWLYQARDGYPSLSYSDNSDTSNVAVHSIRFTPLSDMTVYLGVYGSPVAIEGDNNKYLLEAWQAREVDE